MGNPSIIVCSVCGETRPLCAKGKCRPCYARHYDRAHPRKPGARKPKVTYECERCGVAVTKHAGHKNLRTCARCASRLWSATHPDRVNERSRARRAADPETHRAKERAYRLVNPALHKARDRRYRERYPELVRRRQLECDEKRREKQRVAALRWQKDNPARHAANELARRAKIAGLFVEYVHPLAVLEFHDGVCGICGEDVDPSNFHVDHIEPLFLRGEHSYANTQPAHPLCNMRKGRRAVA